MKKTARHASLRAGKPQKKPRARMEPERGAVIGAGLKTTQEKKFFTLSVQDSLLGEWRSPPLFRDDSN